MAQRLPGVSLVAKGDGVQRTTAADSAGRYAGMPVDTFLNELRALSRPRLGIRPWARRSESEPFAGRKVSHLRA